MYLQFSNSTRIPLYNNSSFSPSLGCPEGLLNSFSLVPQETQYVSQESQQKVRREMREPCKQVEPWRESEEKGQLGRESLCCQAADAYKNSFET